MWISQRPFKNRSIVYLEKGIELNYREFNVETHQLFFFDFIDNVNDNRGIWFVRKTDYPNQVNAVTRWVASNALISCTLGRWSRAIITSERKLGEETHLATYVFTVSGNSSDRKG